jgi:hypothetical protein
VWGSGMILKGFGVVASIPRKNMDAFMTRIEISIKL